MFADKLRKSLLQAAIQGQLTEQLPTDGDARDLLKKIRDEKAKLIKAKKIKAEKPLPPVTDDEIPFELPANWCWCRLGDIASVLSDGIHGTPSYDSTGEFYFVNGNNLINGRILIKPDTKRVNRIEYEKYKKSLSNNTVLVSINGTLGNIAFYNNEKIILGKSACYFNLLGNVSKYFMKHLLSTRFFLSYANDKATGTTIKNVSLQAMKNFLLPLPPLAEQERIVERLDALLTEVEELAKDERELNLHVKNFPRKMKNSLLQAAIQGRLTEQLPTDGDARDLLKKIRDEKAKLIAAKKIKAEKSLPPVTDDEIPFELPANWCWCRLGDIGTWGAGATPLKGNPAFYENATIPWLVTGDLNDGLITNVPRKISALALEKTSVKLNPIDSVLVAMYGATIGKIGMLTFPATTNQACCACQTFEDIEPWYLMFFLMFQRRNFIKQGVGGAQPNISKEKIISTLFPLPPLAEQLRIVERLNELLPLCEI